jgi:membrane protease YdiL (CAAX protease family)
MNKLKSTLLYIFTFILGYAFFVLPDIIFGVFKSLGGKQGINLLWMALFQFISVTLLVRWSLKKKGKSLQHIGLTKPQWKHILLGTLFGMVWWALQVLYIFPITEADFTYTLSHFDGSWSGAIFFLCLGVIGGGITEEIFNRGYTITGMKDLFENKKLGLIIATSFSILVFAIGHLPGNTLEWIDILVPTSVYTALYLLTGRLTASIFAHGVYNAGMIIYLQMQYVAL